MIRPAVSLVVGGTLWLAAVALLESGTDVDSFDVRACFVGAGTFAAGGFLGLKALLTARAGRVGALWLAVTSAMAAVGFGLGSFVGFTLVYASHLFLAPMGMAILTVGLWRGGGLPSWARWIAAAMASAGLVTYGFHAVAPELWDPPDAVLFVVTGAGWIILGTAALAVRMKRPERAHVTAPLDKPHLRRRRRRAPQRWGSRPS